MARSRSWHAAGPPTLTLLASVRKTAVEQSDARSGWGWRPDHAGQWHPLGRLVGWLDGADLCPEPEASYVTGQVLFVCGGSSLGGLSL